MRASGNNRVGLHVPQMMRGCSELLLGYLAVLLALVDPRQACSVFESQLYIHTYM